MMDIKQYIASGILEEYCLGLLSGEEEAYVTQMSLLYPEIKNELTAIELALEDYSRANAVSPVARLREKILGNLSFNNTPETLDLNNLPITNSQANHLQWLEALKHLIPENPTEDFFAEVLRSEPALAQTLVITKCDVPDETHGDLIESFFILKGECICTVGNTTHHLHAGDFLEIPLHTHHDIRIVSPYVVGILQHQLL